MLIRGVTGSPREMVHCPSWRINHTAVPPGLVLPLDIDSLFVFFVAIKSKTELAVVGSFRFGVEK
ncbi:hypothetical protein Dimus_021135, partial [Dionaea muscipula]